MNFDYSDDQKMLQQSIRSLFKKKYPVSYSREFMEQGNKLNALTKVLADQGLLGILCENPESINEGLIYSVLSSYEAGRVLLPYPLLESQVASYLLTKVKATEEYLESLMAGEKIFTYAWNTNQAEFDGKELSGSFSFVPFADQADFMIIEIGKGTTKKFLVIELRNSAVTYKKVKSMDQTYPLFKVQINKYKISDQALLFADERGEMSQAIKEFSVLLVAAEAIGASEEILERTVEYTKERTQFGQPIGKFQAVKHQAAEMYLLFESSKALLKYASWIFSSNQVERLKMTSHMLKSHTSDSVNELMGKSIQIHGGIGFTWESDVHMFYKRCRRISVMHGDAYFHRNHLFTEVMELYKKEVNDRNETVNLK